MVKRSSGAPEVRRAELGLTGSGLVVSAGSAIDVEAEPDIEQGQQRVVGDVQARMSYGTDRSDIRLESRRCG